MLEWYKLRNGKAFLMNQVRYDARRRSLFLGFLNASEADDGIYFCTVLYVPDGTKLERFYGITTKPMFTYGKVLNRNISRLAAQSSTDGFRDYTDIVLKEF